MNKTTPAFKGEIFVPNALVYFVCLAILITLSHPLIQLWIWQSSISPYRLSSRRSAPTSVKVLTRYSFLHDCPLPSILLRGFQNSGIFLGRNRNFGLKLVALLATTTRSTCWGVFTVTFSKTMIQTIELAMKYNVHILENTLPATNRMCATTNHWQQNLGLITPWTLYLSSKTTQKEFKRPSDASRLRNGRQTWPLSAGRKRLCIITELIVLLL